MHEPNVIGDWQEYDDELTGLRVRVHQLKKGDVPPDGRDSEARGLTYFSFRITVENRAAEYFSVELESRNVNVRTGRDGEAAFVDRVGSKWIDGFDVYPMRRATAVVYAAGPAKSLETLDIQVQARIDEELVDRYLWVGGVGVRQNATGLGRRAAGGRDSLASEVSRFLAEGTGPDAS